MRDDIPLGPGKEFDLVRALEQRWGDAAHGIGDDAALIDVPPGHQLVVSADSAVDGVHFRRDWLTPREIGWRVAAAALSDLAAMAADPLSMLVSLSIPDAWLGDILDLADGFADAARATSAHIAGGDLAGARELCIAITVLGAAVNPLRRNGARPGDVLYVTVRMRRSTCPMVCSATRHTLPPRHRCGSRLRSIICPRWAGLRRTPPPGVGTNMNCWSRRLVTSTPRSSSADSSCRSRRSDAPKPALAMSWPRCTARALRLAAGSTTFREHACSDCLSHDGPHDHRARRSHCRTVALRCAHSAGQLSGPRAARLVQSGAVGIGGSPYGAQSRAHRRAQ